MPLIARSAIPVWQLFLIIAISVMISSCGQKADTTLFLHSLRYATQERRRQTHHKSKCCNDGNGRDVFHGVSPQEGFLHSRFLPAANLYVPEGFRLVVALAKRAHRKRPVLSRLFSLALSCTTQRGHTLCDTVTFDLSSQSVLFLEQDGRFVPRNWLLRWVQLRVFTRFVSFMRIV